MVQAGLHVIFDSACDDQHPRVAELDVVAVHGLNFKNSDEHALKTWTKGGKLWLRDFLPDKLSSPARILLFAYNSSPAMRATAMKLTDHANNLLQWLNLKRKALVTATLDITYTPIMEATRLLVFFATPHRGGNHARVGDVVAKIVRMGTHMPRNDLLDTLREDSDQATQRFEQARHLFERCLVASFFEGRPYGKMGLIVDKQSAILNLPGTREKQIAMDADHSSICKFDSADDLASFFRSGFIRKWRSSGWPVHWSLLRDATVTAECGDIKLTMPIGTSYGDIASAFTSTIIGAVAEFQETFPDRSGLRVALVDQCLHMRNAFPRTLELSKAMAFHTDLCISVLLERTLQRLVSSLEHFLQNPKREDWASACFAVCLLLLGAESLQVDIYLNKPIVSRDVEATEESEIASLVGLFRESTNGVNPLEVDWNKRHNLVLLGVEPDMVYAMQDLQDLVFEYRRMLQARRTIEFTVDDTDCLTGKSGSEAFALGLAGAGSVHPADPHYRY
ncbi:hypothetical protein F53441_8335 [Fusarium austroafricanum]|uniref:Uncharacterized protein n=1 Tax=Fusarium austroafricanum TaxID=2364996 RepID=A0A8H4KFA8_9HYPO|nr:hypothetical protein F53441_8335 [Fusarium austroafricanum]